MMKTGRLRLFTAITALLAWLLGGFFCTAAGAGITFWSTEVEKDRMKVQKDIADSFSRKTGIPVQVVPVQENLLAERVTASYAARSLPDVMLVPMDYLIGWAVEGILDLSTGEGAVRDLGEETFVPRALQLARIRGGLVGVPMDGWGQLLLYRKDLFKEKGLSTPDTWETILRGARTLHKPPLLWGFEAATDPGQIYTQQVFEHFALSNGVRLTDSSGNIALNTPAMVQTLEFYKSLARFTPPGNLYWLHTRMDYLSGRAAMIVWSPFILDELSGLRRDQPVVPDMAKGKPGFLSRNTGFVTAIKGPHGKAQWGQIKYLGITRDADKAAAGAWVKFLLTERYLDWLGMAAEGKLPMRRGTREAPERFVDGWLNLEFGVTTRARVSEFYGMDLAESLMGGLAAFDRWGFTEGKGLLVAKIYGTKVIPQILKQFLDGELTAAQAAQMMDQRVKALE